MFEQSVLASTLVLCGRVLGWKTSRARMQTGLANWWKRHGSAGELSQDPLEGVNWTELHPRQQNMHICTPSTTKKFAYSGLTSLTFLVQIYTWFSLLSFQFHLQTYIIQSRWCGDIKGMFISDRVHSTHPNSFSTWNTVDHRQHVILITEAPWWKLLYSLI